MVRYVLPGVVALVATAPALAADLPRRNIPPAPEVAAPIPFNWTGVYVGLNGGSGFRRDVTTTRPDGTLDAFDAETLALLRLDRDKSDDNGFVGGGQVGYNYQLTPGFGPVIGVEADAQFADLNRKRAWTESYSAVGNDFSLVEQANVSTRSSLNYLGTVRGRLGYAFDRVLVYGTGGFAYGHADYRYGVDFNYSLATTGALPVTGVIPYAARSDRWRTGYAYGAGLEYALPVESMLGLPPSSAVTLAGEYLHYDLGTETVRGFGYGPGGRHDLVSSTRVRNEGDLVRGRLSFKFGL